MARTKFPPEAARHFDKATGIGDVEYVFLRYPRQEVSKDGGASDVPIYPKVRLPHRTTEVLPRTYDYRTAR